MSILALISTSVTLVNTVTVTATEKTISIPAGTKQLFIKLRDASVSWVYSFTATGTTTLYRTVPAGGELQLTNLQLHSQTGLKLYVSQSSGGDLVLEQEYWK